MFRVSLHHLFSMRSNSLFKRRIFPLGLDDSAGYPAALCLKIDGMTFVGVFLKKYPLEKEAEL